VSRDVVVVRLDVEPARLSLVIVRRSVDSVTQSLAVACRDRSFASHGVDLVSQSLDSVRRPLDLVRILLAVMSRADQPTPPRIAPATLSPMSARPHLVLLGLASCSLAACKGGETYEGPDASDTSVCSPSVLAQSSEPNCGSSDTHEEIAVCCAGPLTADSGPSSPEAALASVPCGDTVLDQECASYRLIMIYPPPSEGAATLYYYGSDGSLVAVVVRQDASGDTCATGPAGWIEPCNAACTAIDAGSLPACIPGGDGG
jgi:hypothetical protein